MAVFHHLTNTVFILSIDLDVVSPNQARRNALIVVIILIQSAQSLLRKVSAVEYFSVQLLKIEIDGLEVRLEIHVKYSKIIPTKCCINHWENSKMQ